MTHSETFYEPFLPTHSAIIGEKLKLAGVRPGEIVFDMGCGDGQVLIRAVQDFGAVGVGYEIRHELVIAARQAVEANGLMPEITIHHSDFMTADVRKADVVILYLNRGTLGSLAHKLRRELAAGARIVTHDFDLPGWGVTDHMQRPSKMGVLIDMYLYVQS